MNLYNFLFYFFLIKRGVFFKKKKLKEIEILIPLIESFSYSNKKKGFFKVLTRFNEIF
jgi:hypothetical protein